MNQIVGFVLGFFHKNIWLDSIKQIQIRFNVVYHAVAPGGKKSWLAVDTQRRTTALYRDLRDARGPGLG